MSTDLRDSVIAPSPELFERLEGADFWLEREGAEAALLWAAERFGERFAISTEFDAGGVALIDLASRVLDRPHVFFVDTGFLYEETHELRERLEDRYGFEIVAVRPQFTPQEQEDAFGSKLWVFDSDFCCSLRRDEPLERHLANFGAWATAVRREQSWARAAARTVEWDARWGLVRVNPLASWTAARVWDYVRDNALPYNAVYDRGLQRVGCTHCTKLKPASTRP